jgi:Ycf66 protein N-terminus
MLIFGLNSANVLAQVNLGTTPATFLGIFLAVAGAGLYFLRTVKPELSRDHDIFFAAIGLLAGFILIFQGWRLDPILQFGQVLLVGSTVFFAYESIRLRGIATEQAKRNTPIVDDERPVSRDYKNYSNRRPGRAERVGAELEPLPYYDDEEDDRPRARITGSREGRPQRDDYYEEDAPRRSSRRSSNDKPEISADRSSRRRNSARPTSRTSENIDDGDWGSSSPSRQGDDWDSSTEERRPTRSRGESSSSRPEIRDDEQVTQPKPRRRRPASDASPRYQRDDDEAIPTDYVDYKPIDRLEDRPESSTNYDDDAPV